MGKIIAGGGIFALIVTLVGAVFGLGQSDKVYPLGVDAAQSALVGTTITSLAFGMTARGEPAVRTANGVAWHITRLSGGGGQDLSGSEVMVMTATLTPVAGGTQVAVDIQSAPGTSPDIFARRMADRPSIARLFRSIAHEQVDATLTHRDFAFANIRQDMALAAFSVLPEIGKQMEEAGDAAQQRDRETLDNAYKQGETYNSYAPQHERPGTPGLDPTPGQLANDSALDVPRRDAPGTPAIHLN